MENFKETLAAIGGLLLWLVAFWLPFGGLYLLSVPGKAWYGIMSICAGVTIGAHLLCSQGREDRNNKLLAHKDDIIRSLRSEIDDLNNGK